MPRQSLPTINPNRNSTKPSKSLNGELPNNSHKGICKDIERLRGKYTGLPVKRGMWVTRPKPKTP